MIILHISAIDNSPYSGVSVVVPRHVSAQEKMASVAIVNILHNKINGVKKQLNLDRSISNLPSPFNKPDIVIFHQVFYFKYIAISRELKKRNIPFVIVPHGCLSKDALRIKQIKKKLGMLLAFNTFVKSSAFIQCLSEKEASDITIKHKKIVLSNGIDVPLEGKKAFKTKNKKFIFIGRLDIFHKGLDNMLLAFASKKDLCLANDVKLEIYGPDINGSRHEIERMVQNLGLTDIVSINDGIVGETKKMQLLYADIFIQTSRFEGMPMGVLEALSYGIPCLVTDGTTLSSYVVKYNSGWAAMNNVNAISSSLEQAILSEDKELEEKSRGAVELVLKEFDWDSIATKSVSEYSNFVN